MNPPPLRVPIRVKPGAARPSVGGRYGEDQLIVAVGARPVEGAANEAVISAVAAALGLRPRHVTIVQGHTSRSKVIEIEATPEESVKVRSLLADLMQPCDL